MDFFQSSKFKAWVVIAKVTGVMSIIGSSLIIRDVLRKENRRKKLKSTTNRIVTLMSVCDVLITFFNHFLGTWLVPKSPWVWMASGNQGTCTFQGFIGSLCGAAGTALNATLAVTYVLVVRFGWKDDRLQTRFMSFVLLGMPILASLGFSIWPLIDQAFNWNGGWTCSYGAAPLGCSVTGGDPYPCVRGFHTKQIDGTAMIWGLICFTLIFVSTVTLYWTVLKREMATDKYAVDESQRNRKQSKRVAMQGIWFSGSFFLTWISYWIVVVLEFANKRPPFWILTATATLIPLQGLFNAIVFFRPRHVSKGRRNGSSLMGSSMRQSSLARHAITLFSSKKFSMKPSDTGTTSQTPTMSCKSSNNQSLASVAGNETEQFKDEAVNTFRRDEETPVVNEEP